MTTPDAAEIRSLNGHPLADSKARDQIASLSNTVSEQAAKLDDMLVTSESNLLKGKWVQGGFDETTGNENSYENNYRLTSWIPVKPNTSYTFTQWSGSRITCVYHMWYDDSRRFISRTAHGPGSASGVPTMQTAPDRAVWLRLYIYINAADGGNPARIVDAPCQLEEGVNGTDYVSAMQLNPLYLPPIPEKQIIWRPSVPEYYMADNYLPNKIARINALARNVGANGDAFVFICDMHWEKNAGNSPALLKYLHDNTRIDRLFGGGDYMDIAVTAAPPLFEAVAKLRDAWPGPRYLTLGNHDYMGSEACALKDSDLYYAVNSYGTERIGNLSRNYYYVDNPQVKLRYIVLNRYADRIPVTNEINGLDEEQRGWLQNEALQVEDGWGVLVFVHDLYRFVFPSSKDEAAVTLTYADSAAVVSILDAFKASGGTVIGIFCGEAHSDRINYTPGGIPVITTTCDKNKSSGEGTPISLQWSERLDGTIHEQAFDVVIVDKTARTIHAIRIGYPARNSMEGTWGEKVEERTITY